MNLLFLTMDESGGLPMQTTPHNPTTTYSPTSGVPSDGAGCASTMFDIHDIPHQKLCGKVSGRK